MAKYIMPKLLRHMVMQAINFDVVATSFLNHLTIERGLASNTLEAYRRDLAKFELFLQGDSLSQVTPEKISEFETALKSQNLSLASISRIDSTLRGFSSMPIVSSKSRIQHLKCCHSVPIDDYLKL